MQKLQKFECLLQAIRFQVFKSYVCGIVKIIQTLRTLGKQLGLNQNSSLSRPSHWTGRYRLSPRTEVFLIRPVTPEDSASVNTVAVASGLFPADASEFLDKMMADYFNSNREEGHICVIDAEEEPLGVAYYQPALATDRTWYLTMIAVRQDRQGQRRGTALLNYVENALQENGQRVLLVETSGLPDFDLTRTFYAKCGYEEEARVRDYYATGEDMVLFRKVLNAE